MEEESNNGPVTEEDLINCLKCSQIIISPTTAHAPAFCMEIVGVDNNNKRVYKIYSSIYSVQGGAMSVAQDKKAVHLICAKCGDAITAGGAECRETSKEELFIQSKYPHYESDKRRDEAVLLLQEGGIEAWPLGCEAPGTPKPHFFVLWEIREAWKARIRSGLVPGVIWHSAECLSQKRFCLCDACAVTTMHRCPLCAAQLTPITQ
ncbi:MAG: hypothetical protein UY19_C0018G0019 [Candidatus Wolfebacteria bacterium GW2011_GWA2_47_9b]|uniref:Uncharacterized protein n=2 Tax=Candidatus Wolfeibacteriota TaxID=1752735 RepID=A0A0G1U556_9BACT|nr:MAG: hypothetical protein UY19_C0018G0019 [Candidatus Wolfebacteria bacterium GW2011_GWA2_47_9b]